MPPLRKIIVCREIEELSLRAAEEFVSLTRQAAGTVGRFAVALAGGSTPKNLYSLLATSGFRGRIPWPQIHLFWGDERCVPPDHPESNYHMVDETLLSKVPIPAENVYRMEGEEDPEVAARRYEETLKKFFQLSDNGLPRFDLILLGLGEDGHTASLFPGSDAVQESKRLVTALYVEKLKAFRLTLTLPVLNHSANIFFLVAGKNKARVLKDVLQGGDGSESLPAQRVNPRMGRLLWFADQAAADFF